MEVNTSSCNGLYIYIEKDLFMSTKYSDNIYHGL